MIGVLYFKNDLTGEWETFEAIQGAQGIQGQIGLTGPIGPQGPQGIQGEKGDKGDQGDPYVLTDTDLHIIADEVLANFPVAEEVEW